MCLSNSIHKNDSIDTYTKPLTRGKNKEISPPPSPTRYPSPKRVHFNRKANTTKIIGNILNQKDAMDILDPIYNNIQSYRDTPSSCLNMFKANYYHYIHDGFPWH